MRRQILWSHGAVEDLFEISVRDARLGRRLMVGIRGYRMAERVDLKKLAGSDDTWRIRVGDWRVLLVTSGDGATIERIENRRDAY